MSYFQSFPKIQYTAFDTPTVVTDITLRTKILDNIETSVYAYETYTIMDGDRPDTVSYRYYGRSDLDWLILTANNMLSLDDWPKADGEILTGLLSIYGSISAIDSTLNPDAILYYEDINGNVVSYDQAGEKFPITILQNEYRENELKKIIRLVKKDYVGSILSQQINLLKL
jgi:hypothetical protein